MWALAEAVIAATATNWDKDYAARYILDNHTWENRVAIYDRLLRSGGDAVCD